MAGKIKEITAKDFEKEVLSKKFSVIDFYSTECPPCEALAPKYEALSNLYGDDVYFTKIFRQENRELAERLGVKSSPTVIFFKDGKEVGDVLTGGVTRSSLIKNLDALVGEERGVQIKKNIENVETRTQVLIMGGGPAGLTAGIYAAQARLDVIVLDIGLPGGQVSTTHQVSNYPGFIEPQQGFMLMHYMSEQAKEAGVKFKSAVEITSVNLNKKEVVVDGFETISAEKIIVATGASPRPLGIVGEKEYKGKGISYCATCDGKYFDGKDVIVIGGGNSALEESLFLRKFAKALTIVHQFDDFQANKVAQEKVLSDENITVMFSHEPREFIKKENGKMGVVVENLKTKEKVNIEADGIFVFVGMKPNIDAFEGFELDDFGYIKTDDEQRTNIKDCFAVGDVASKRYRQITIATAEGTVAAIAASKDFI